MFIDPNKLKLPIGKHKLVCHFKITISLVVSKKNFFHPIDITTQEYKIFKVTIESRFLQFNKKHDHSL